MSLGYYGILIIFAAFFLLLIFRPSLTCFGRKIKSPFYPLFRRKKLKKKLKTHDYGFSLVDEQGRQKAEEIRLRKSASKEESPVDESRTIKESEPSKKKLKTQDYGFSLVDEQDRQKAEKIRLGKSASKEESPVDESRKKNESEPRKKKLKTQDYGFSLVNDDEQEESIK